MPEQLIGRDCLIKDGGGASLCGLLGSEVRAAVRGLNSNMLLPSDGGGCTASIVSCRRLMPLQL